MAKFFKLCIALFLSLFLYIFAGIGYAAPDDFTSLEVNDDTSAVSDTDALNELLATDSTGEASTPNINVSSDNFGLVGPLKIGAEYSQNFGGIVKAQFLQALNYSNALGIMLDLGSKEYRINGTWGHDVSDAYRFKLTGEYLAQKLDFDFASGTQSKFVGQTAIGLVNQFFIGQKYVRALYLNPTYSKAQSKDLGKKYFDQAADGSYNYLDYMRIAGGEDRSLSAGVDLLPFQSTLLALELNYDSIKYDTQYNTDSDDTSGLGATAKVQQLFNKYLKLEVLASSRKPYTNYKAELNWLAVTDPNYRIELGLTGERIIGNTDDDTADDTRFGLNVNYKWGSESFDQHEGYAFQTENAREDLVSFTAIPAVHMEKVLAVKDEKIVKVEVPAFNSITLQYTFGIDVGSDDITERLMASFGDESLKSITTDPDFSLYGLHIALSQDGKHIIVTGVPNKITDSPLSVKVTVVNSGGKSNTGNVLTLIINPVAPTLIIKRIPEDIPPFYVGQHIDSDKAVLIAEIKSGGKPITSVTIDNTKLATHNLQSVIAPDNSSIKIFSPTGVTNATTGDPIAITATDGLNPVSGNFILIITDKPVISPNPMLQFFLPNASVTANVGSVNWGNGTPGSIIYDATNFSNCFLNTGDPTKFAISLVSGTNIQIFGTTKNSEGASCSGLVTAKSAENLTSDPVQLTISLTSGPSLVFNDNSNGTAAKGVANGPISAYPNSSPPPPLKYLGHVKAGVGGTVSGGDEFVFDSTLSQCFVTKPTLQLTNFSSGNTEADIEIVNGGKMIANFSSSPCSLNVAFKNDQHAQSNFGIFKIGIVGAPNVTTIVADSDLKETAVSVLLKIAHVSDWGVNSSGPNVTTPVSLTADAATALAPYFNTSLPYSVSIDSNNDVWLAATQKALSDVTPPVDPVTFDKILQVTNEEGASQYADVKIQFTGGPSLTPFIDHGTGTNHIAYVYAGQPIEDATPSSEAKASVNDFVQIGEVDFGPNALPGTNPLMITYDGGDPDPELCFSLLPYISLGDKVSNSTSYYIKLSQGEVSDRAGIANTTCNFAVEATNSAALTQKGTFEVSVFAGKPKIIPFENQYGFDPPSVRVGTTLTPTAPLSFAYVDWGGTDNNHESAKISPDWDALKNNCFDANELPNVSIYISTDHSLYDGTLQVRSGKITSQVPPPGVSSTCTIHVIADNGENTNTSDAYIAVNLLTGIPFVEPYANKVASGTSLAINPLTIGKVLDWGDVPRNSPQATIDDSAEHCFNDNPPLAIAINLDNTLTITQGTVDETEKDCHFLLNVTNYDTSFPPNALTSKTTIPLTIVPSGYPFVISQANPVFPAASGTYTDLVPSSADFLIGRINSGGNSFASPPAVAFSNNLLTWINGNTSTPTITLQPVANDEYDVYFHSITFNRTSFPYSESFENGLTLTTTDGKSVSMDVNFIFVMP